MSQPSSGGSARAAHRAFEVTATADVAAPLLDWSRRALEFSYVYERGVAAQVVEQRLDMRCAGPSCERRGLIRPRCRPAKHDRRMRGSLSAAAGSTPADMPALCLDAPPCRNVSKVTLAFSLRTAPPFSLDASSFELQPGEAVGVTVAFDPNYKCAPGRGVEACCAGLPLRSQAAGSAASTPHLATRRLDDRQDMRSHAARQKLAVAFSDNPQTDALDLLGAIEFPNLALSAQVSVLLMGTVG